ncbi:MAG: 2-amino-4-hydroxy-6-hydroxymethyldihydropteridine diphosphokinase [Pirellulaceae bacterium]
MNDCLIAFGANQGDPLSMLERSAGLLAEYGFQDVVVSRPIRTPAVGGENQAPYLNAVLRAQSTHSAEDAILKLQAIEESMGRVRMERWGPRPIDLDLLLFGNQVVETENVVIPHPRMSFRRFVLEPAVEIAPEVVHAICGVTLRELYESLDSRPALITIYQTEESFRTSGENPSQADTDVLAKQIGKEVDALGSGYEIQVVRDIDLARKNAALSRLMVYARSSRIDLLGHLNGPVLELDSDEPMREVRAAIQAMEPLDSSV